MGAVAVLCIISVAVALSQFFKISEDVLGSLLNWRLLYRVEFNWKAASTRTWAAVCLLLPFWLILGRYIQPSWKCLLLMVSYLAAREIAGLALPLRRLGPDWKKTQRHTLWTLFIPFFFLFFLTFVFEWSTGVSVRGALMVELALLELFNLSCVFKILRTGYSVFLSFLYLCALEFLPMGVWVAFMA